MSPKKRKKKVIKKTYTTSEVNHLHNKYRLVIAGVIALSFFVLHHYGVSFKVIADITGGQVMVKDTDSLWNIILMLGKWSVGFFTVILGVKTFWERFIKKKEEE
jgi:hypothetical protein